MATPQQLELPLEITVSARPGVSVTRLPDGAYCVRAKATVEQWGSVPDAAEILGYSVETVRLMVRAGELKAKRRGARGWYRVDLLHAQQIAGEMEL